ncbi:MAG TPA: hypothetical protein VIB48_14940 [Acidimicrobiia bacterium]|jgi:hypothetical protein
MSSSPSRSRRAPRAASLLVTVVAASLCVATLAPAAAPAGAANGSSGDAVSAGIRERMIRLAVDAAHRHAGTGRAANAVVTGTLAITDPVGDATTSNSWRFRADITNAGLDYAKTSMRVSARLSTGTNPISDPNWQGATGLVWLLDTTGDGTADDGAVYLADTDGRLLGAVVQNINSSPTLRCLASAVWDGAHVYSMSFPTACIGQPAIVNFGADMTYEVNGVQSEDLAPDSGQPLAGSVQASTPTTTPDAGQFVVDGFGGLHFVGIGTHTHAPHVLGGPYWPGRDIARDVTVFPGGGHGYVLDGFGALHPFSLSPNQNPAVPPDGPYWPNYDIARGAAMFTDGRGGVVLDGLGGLHPFSLGTHHSAPAISGAPYWPGWDIAQGVAMLPDGTGGFVLDGFGGLHFFSIGTHHTAPRVIDAPYWPNWNIARGVTILPDGTGGYVIDAWGGLHFFSIGTRRSAPTLTGAPYWPNWDIARGVSAIQGVIPTA